MTIITTAGWFVFTYRRRSLTYGWIHLTLGNYLRLIEAVVVL